MSLPIKSDTFNKSYAIIIHKKKIQNTVSLTLLTPQFGFLDVFFLYPKKSKTPPLFVQPLNLIEGILRLPNYKQKSFVLTEIDLRYSFFNEIPYYHHWFLMTLLNNLKHNLFLGEQEESPKIFMMLLKLLNLSPYINNPTISEFMCLTFLVKTILILKLQDSILFCSGCKTPIFTKEMDLSYALYYSNEIHGFICHNCIINKSLHFLDPIEQDVVFLLKSVIFLPLDELLKKNMNTYIEKYLQKGVLIFNHFFFSLFNKDWENFIKKNLNPFL